MKILLRQVLIADPLSPHHDSTVDILIDNGTITEIGKISAKADSEFTVKDACVSPGWVDIFADTCDPGFEFRETIETAAAAALAGGFTALFTLPNTSPCVCSKSQVEYIRQRAANLPVQFFPLGAITKNIAGKELAEMYDMQSSGAIAFTDGWQPVQTPGLFLKALQYVKAFSGVLIQLPVDSSIGAHGLMNEGIVSTQLGLPGIPALAEENMIRRDIELLRYTGSRLHITGISTAKSLGLIRQAKGEGLDVTCSVTPHHLYFCDEDLREYDTNLKVNPPLRTTADRQALREGVLNGDIDCIATHHLPQDSDHKICEFESAGPGMTALQTAFSITCESLPTLGPGRVAELFGTAARRIFALPTATIQKGAEAGLTIFSLSGHSTPERANVKSRSFNTPFLGQTLRGKVLGTFTKGKLFLTN